MDNTRLGARCCLCPFMDWLPVQVRNQLWLLVLLLSINTLTKAVDPQHNDSAETTSVLSHKNILTKTSIPVLTPYASTLTFSEGEALVVDCGVYTGGQPQDFNMTWKGPQGKILVEESDRKSAVRIDKERPTDAMYNAYSVLTLNITDLVTSDSGVYVCMVEHIVGTRHDTTTANFTLRVVKKETGWCGFEGLTETVCAWDIDFNALLQWHVHSGADDVIIDRAKGARFDHTYGASKHIGHFLDIDPNHFDHVADKASARLLSPVYAKHTEYKCLEFWYISEGRHRGDLLVSLRTKNDPDTVNQLWEIPQEGANEWRKANVTISPQDEDYQIILEAFMCDTAQHCRLAATSIDDISVTSGKCTDSIEWATNTLKIRLLDGSSPTEGRVEVLHDGQWGSVCSRDFGINEAKLICRALGYSPDQAMKRRDGFFGSSPDNSRIWLDKLQCSVAKERDLASCMIAGETWGNTSCTHSQDAAVICSQNTNESTPAMVPSTTTTPIPVANSTESPTTIKQIPTPRPDLNATQRTVQTPNSTTTLPSTITSTSPGINSTKTSTLPAFKTKSTTPAKKAPNTTTTKEPTPAPQANPNKTTEHTTPSGSPITTTSTSTSATASTKSSTTATNATTPTPTPTPTPAATPAPSTKTTQKPSPQTTVTVTPKTPTPRPAKSSSTPRADPNIVSLPPDVEQYNPGNNAGVAIGIIFALLVAATGIGILLYKRKRKGKKSTYITFGNPSYSREHLPANDFSLESPLTLSSNGYTVLA